jgi:hypothetical protein
MSHKNELELAAGSGPVGGARGDPKMSRRRVSPITVVVVDNNNLFLAKMESWPILRRPSQHTEGESGECRMRATKHKST